jgi:hypothetical protein
MIMVDPARRDQQNRVARARRNKRADPRGHEQRMAYQRGYRAQRQAALASSG